MCFFFKYSGVILMSKSRKIIVQMCQTHEEEDCLVDITEFNFFLVAMSVITTCRPLQSINMCFPSPGFRENSLPLELCAFSIDDNGPKGTTIPKGKLVLS